MAAAAYDGQLAAFVDDLNRLHIEFGAPSYGEICAAADVFKLTKAGITDLLTGKRLPSMNFLLEFVRVVSNPLPVDATKPKGHRAHPELIELWRRRWVDLRALNRQLQAPLGRIRNATKLLVETAERTAAETIGSAEAHAWQLRSWAEAEAAHLVEEARQQVARLLGEATEQANAVRAEAERIRAEAVQSAGARAAEADRRATAARQEAEEVRRSARAEAQGIVDEGRRVSRLRTPAALRELREAAEKLAEEQVPELIRTITTGRLQETVSGLVFPSVGLYGRDDVGRLAHCFDELVRFAVKQALLHRNATEIFGDLSRRNQLLTHRQLLLLSELEGREADPERLTDLFKLDHLATRLRRNTENSLMFAGAVGRRRTGPVPLLDVFRAAAGEAESYERIGVGAEAVPPVEVAGPAVNDLVHLLAELLDNATVFSPPYAQVRTAAHALPDGRVLIEIHDAGIGLSSDGLAEINELLTNPPLVNTASGGMGLFVVGRLSLRHDIRVQLTPSDSGGTTALVMLPGSLVQLPAAPDMGVLPSGSGSAVVPGGGEGE
ncbi:ATP-binding protein [Kitasatospora sp. NPDC096128]|uniref:sensor histidine kinase n=1 Tax=Kitasatospora sp. NPDC096128 TaxID=3155547 RepID=UPI0033208E9F